MKFLTRRAVAPALAFSLAVVLPAASEAAASWTKSFVSPSILSAVNRVDPAPAPGPTGELTAASDALTASAESRPVLSPRLKLPEFSFLPQAADQGRVPTPGVTSGVAPPQPELDHQKARFLRVLRYSLQLIFYEHVMRVAVQPFTRAELDGPFWRDYLDSVKMPKQWGDGDSWEVNYIGHSMHGSAGVRLWLDQREQDYQDHGKAHYWKAMGRAFLFGTLFSIQFEIGPLSEASIGNVGLREGRTGWVDHVVTPIGSVLWTMYEDAMDKYVVTWIEKHVPFNMAKVAARMILCPAWMLANVGQNRLPWARANRPLTFVK